MYTAAEVDELFLEWKKEGQTKEQLVVNTAKAEIGWPYGWGAVASICTPDKRKYYSQRSNCPPKDAENLIERCQVLRTKAARKKDCNGCEFYPGNVTGLNDCQGFIKQLMERVGISLAGGGCTTMWDNDSNWTEKGVISQIPKRYVCLAFQRDPTNPQKMQHVGLHVGDGVIIECATTVKYNNTSKSAWTHYAMVRGLGGNTPMPTHPTIRKGSTGPDVVECQNILIKLGYDLAPYGADGKFGNKTAAAVKAFQSTHTDPTTGRKLAVDGVVGPASWAALEEAAPDPSGGKYSVTIPGLTKDEADNFKKVYPDAIIRKEG